MRSKTNRGVWLLPLLALGVAAASFAQPPTPQQAPRPVQSWTWDQVKDRFELDNPTLLAGKLNIDELKAQEITAHLRPNPDLTLLSDQIAPFSVGQPHGAYTYLLPSATVSYLI